jgi:predicted O-methyltransferase YrrM
VNPKQRQLEDEALEWFKTEKFANFGRFDTLFLICKNADASSFLDRTLSAVRPSGTVVVYSPSAPVSC